MGYVSGGLHGYSLKLLGDTIATLISHNIFTFTHPSASVSEKKEKKRKKRKNSTLFESTFYSDKDCEAAGRDAVGWHAKRAGVILHISSSYGCSE